MRTLSAVLGLAALTAGEAAAEVPVTLRGSPESMERQNRVAREHGLSFYRVPAQIRRAIEAGELVRLEGNENYELKSNTGVALPEMRVFVERLSEGYRGGCGEKLVVTSLTRAASTQPPNAHPLSVHPAGMAVDLRIPANARCRTWLERELLAMERDGLLDATREQRPPHYHVALFPRPFLASIGALPDEPTVVRPAVEPSLEPAAATHLHRHGEEEAMVPGGGVRPEEPATPKRGITGWIGRLLSAPLRAIGLVK